MAGYRLTRPSGEKSRFKNAASMASVWKPGDVVAGLDASGNLVPAAPMIEAHISMLKRDVERIEAMLAEVRKGG